MGRTVGGFRAETVIQASRTLQGDWKELSRQVMGGVAYEVSRTAGGFRNISFGRQIAGNISLELGRMGLGNVALFGRSLLGDIKLELGRAQVGDVRLPKRIHTGNLCTLA